MGFSSATVKGCVVVLLQRARNASCNYVLFGNYSSKVQVVVSRGCFKCYGRGHIELTKSSVETKCALTK